MTVSAVTIPLSKLALRMRELNALLTDPKLVETPSKIDEMLRRRDELANAQPRSDFDALALLVLAESAASGLLRGTVEELQQEGVHQLAGEVLTIVTTLARAFESRIGLTAAELGLKDQVTTH